MNTVWHIIVDLLLIYLTWRNWKLSDKIEQLETNLTNLADNTAVSFQHLVERGH